MLRRFLFFPRVYTPTKNEIITALIHAKKIALAPIENRIECKNISFFRDRSFYTRVDSWTNP